MGNFIEWLLTESSSTRYSIEVNYRTQIDEALTHFARICLGYASAGLKKADFHVKQVFDDSLPRIMVSNRNWDDGTWTVIFSWNSHHKCFFLTKGFYRKDTKSISRQGEPEKSNATNASEIVKQVQNVMHHLKDKPDRHIAKMKSVALKRGPKN